jgi:hypothetical protein
MLNERESLFTHLSSSFGSVAEVVQHCQLNSPVNGQVLEGSRCISAYELTISKAPNCIGESLNVSMAYFDAPYFWIRPTLACLTGRDTQDHLSWP